MFGGCGRKIKRTSTPPRSDPALALQPVYLVPPSMYLNLLSQVSDPAIRRSRIPKRREITLNPFPQPLTGFTQSSTVRLHPN
jgi:hypothetical protein